MPRGIRAAVAATAASVNGEVIGGPVVGVGRNVGSVEQFVVAS